MFEEGDRMFQGGRCFESPSDVVQEGEIYAFTGGVIYFRVRLKIFWQGMIYLMGEEDVFEVGYHRL